MSRPWMPLWIADYLADTAHLNAAQSGAYLHLIMHYWQHGGLPTDDAQLAQIGKMSRGEWRKNREILAGLFQENWTHKRVEIELAEAEEKYQLRADAGHKGGIKSAETRRKNKQKAEAAAPSPQADTGDSNEAMLQANGKQCFKQTASKNEPTTTTTTEEDGGGGRAGPGNLPDWMRTPGYRLAKQVAELCGKGDEFDFTNGQGWNGATRRVGVWIAHFEDRGEKNVEREILNSVREQLRTKRDGPPSAINFFEKGIARHFARIRAQETDPLPEVTITPKQPETVSVSHARQDHSKSGFAAIDRVFGKVREGEGGGAAGPHENAVLLLPARPVP